MKKSVQIPESTFVARADFDIFNQGSWRVSQGVGNFSPLTLLTRRRCAAPRLRQAIADCRTFLKIIEFFLGGWS